MDTEKEMIPVVDKFVNKGISRKLMVFVMGTAFFLLHTGLTSEDWMTLAVAYVGTQGFIDAIVAFRGGKQ